MIKKSLYEELTIHIHKEELARLLSIEPSFEVQSIDPEGNEFRFTLCRATKFDEASPKQEERRRFL